MRIVSDTKAIKRNQTIARWTLFSGVAVLVLALVANLYVAVPLLSSGASSQAELTPQQNQLTLFSFVGLLVGYTLTTISTSINARFGRRPDQALQGALRGSNDSYTLYNYVLGASHVVAAPSGLYVLVPKYQSGVILVDEKGKWKHAGQSGLSRFLFRQDALGNPTLDARLEVEALQRHLKKHHPEVDLEPQPIVVFMSPRAVLDIAHSPVPAVPVKKLKDYIRKQPKRGGVSAEVASRLAGERATEDTHD